MGDSEDCNKSNIGREGVNEVRLEGIRVGVPPTDASELNEASLEFKFEE